MVFSQKDYYSVSEWLEKISGFYPTEIELGLERVFKVADKLQLLQPKAKVITVGGTNGKGSTIAGLQSIYLAAGYRVGTFTSPFLYTINELIRINGICVRDEDFLRALKRIEQAAVSVKLSPFECHTLIALILFQEANLDIYLLEVGLGGRLDAVNIIDADLSIVTTIALDHTELLGDTREKIAFEKAGIFRTKRPAICGDFDPPSSLLSEAARIDAHLYCQGKAFGFEQKDNEWCWWSGETRLEHLPLVALSLQNMACVLQCIHLMRFGLPVKREAIEAGLKNIQLSGRIEYQMLAGVPHILDVSHNPAAVSRLSQVLQTKHRVSGKTYAIFSMLKNKDILSSLSVIKHLIDEWYIAPLTSSRGATMGQLTQAFEQIDSIHANFFDNLKDAYLSVQKKATSCDRILIFGSFLTVAEITKLIK